MVHMTIYAYPAYSNANWFLIGGIGEVQEKITLVIQMLARVVLLVSMCVFPKNTRIEEEERRLNRW